MKKVDILLKGAGTVHTCSGAAPKRRDSLLDTGSVKGGVIAVVGDRIAFVGIEEELVLAGLTISNETTVLDCRGGDVVPGFVDSHTHLIWEGDRKPEFARLLRGESYESITAEGGGINTTVSATRNASLDQLVASGRNRLKRMLEYGTTTVESKSGYALNTEGEMRLLEAMKVLMDESPQTIVPTFLGAHLVPREYSDNREEYVRILLDEMLPRVASLGYVRFNDVFMERGAFNRAETERILRRGIQLGLRPRLHADELSDTGAAALAVELGSASCDHLECISDESIALLAGSSTVATLMPGTSFYLNLPSHAPFRKLFEAGCAIALATDFNPGTSPSLSLQGAFTLAVLEMRMPIEAALNAMTINAAYSLGLDSEVGSIEVGKRADLVILKSTPVDMAYHWGENAVAAVVCGGRLFIETKE
ncbi:MAG: imidazolonepropionase [Planctomycetota bacterium]